MYYLPANITGKVLARATIAVPSAIINENNNTQLLYIEMSKLN